MTRNYIGLICENEKSLNLEPGDSVLDVGCGAGAFAAAFGHLGYRVTGVDSSKKMAATAAINGIECGVADCTRPTSFANDQFDLVCAGSVAHGLHRPDRMGLSREMNRIAGKTVLLQDYSPADRGFRRLRFPESSKRSRAAITSISEKTPWLNCGRCLIP